MFSRTQKSWLAILISVSHLVEAPPAQPGTRARTGAPWSGSSGSPFILKARPMSSPRLISSEIGVGRPVSDSVFGALPSTPDQNRQALAFGFRPTRPRMWLIGTYCHSARPTPPRPQPLPVTLLGSASMSCCSQNSVRPLPAHCITLMIERDGILSRSS